jgi:hypothetical protein
MTKVNSNLLLKVAFSELLRFWTTFVPPSHFCDVRYFALPAWHNGHCVRLQKIVGSNHHQGVKFKVLIQRNASIIRDKIVNSAVIVEYVCRYLHMRPAQYLLLWIHYGEMDKSYMYSRYFKIKVCQLPGLYDTDTLTSSINRSTKQYM